MTRAARSAVLTLAMSACAVSSLRPINSDDTDLPDTDTDTDTDAPSCEPLDAPPVTVTSPTLCERPVPLSPPRLKWSLPISWDGVYEVRAGRLLDLDENGVVDAFDPPTLTVSGPTHEVRVHYRTHLIDGRTGAIQDTVEDFLVSTIFRVDPSESPSAWGTGWLAPDVGICGWTPDSGLSCDGLNKRTPVLNMLPVDANHDGKPELAHLLGLLDPRTSTATLDLDENLASWSTTAWDLDGDGIDTQLVAGSAYKLGTLRCDDYEGAIVAVTKGPDGGPLVVRTGRLWGAPGLRIGGAVCGSEVVSVPLGPRETVQGLAIGDLDADGRVELVASLQVYTDDGYLAASLMAVELDGTPMWRVDDLPTGVFSATLADLDGDGAFEVIGGAPAIYEGATGRLLHHLGDPPPYVGSAPGQDFIFPVDIDGDLALDIVVVHQDRVDVYEGTEPWAPGPSVWHSAAFSGSTIEPDMTVPQDPKPPWEGDGTFRAATGHGPAMGAGTDLAARVVRVCEEECQLGSVRVGIQAGNLGERPVERPTDLVLEVMRGGTWEEASRTRYASISAAQWLEGVDVEIDSDPRGEDVRVSLVPAGWVASRECDGAAAEERLERGICE